MVRICLLVLFLTFLPNPSHSWGESSSAKTWRLATELSEAERTLFDPRTDPPHDPRMPSLLA
jgi:hypothetical protein